MAMKVEEKQLKELGAIFSNGLNGQKARIKLLIALSQTNNMKEIEEKCFIKYKNRSSPTSTWLYLL